MSEKLNCWPGCLAIVISDEYEGLPVGSVVECVSFFSGQAVTVDDPKPQHFEVWMLRYKGQEIDPSDGAAWAAEDGDLRPLRDDDGQDEMLRIACLPNKETTPAAH